MKRLIMLATMALCTTAPLSGQSPEDDVMAVVNRLFDGMRAGDSNMVRSVFHPSARMGRATPDGLQLRDGVDSFVNAVGSPHEKVWDEPIWDYHVRVDGKLAQVWTKYAFYLGEDFSHCGVDAFDLYQTPDGWKIFQLVDTNQQDGCESPSGR